VKKVQLPRNSTNHRRDHSELSEMNTKKTNIKLLLIENLLFFFSLLPDISLAVRPIKLLEKRH
jgi:hypothetical protein